MGDRRPVLLVTTEVPPDRVGAFRALGERLDLELALFGAGTGLHATGGVDDHGLIAHEVRQRDVHALAASGRYRAVIAGTVGRTALPAAWLGAERARVPFLLWSALWAHPRSAAHLPGALLLRLLYRRAACVIAYGSHVARFAAAQGARRVVVAPQAVDARWWSDVDRGSSQSRQVLFIGRDAPGKGVDLLLRAWQASGLAGDGWELRLAGPPPGRAGDVAGATALGALPADDVRAELARTSVLAVPSERTATFREPWGLVVNEAMHAGAMVMASTEVGAAAGGLVEDGRTGIVVPAGDAFAWADAMRRAAALDPAERDSLVTAARDRVSGCTHAAWAAAVAGAVEGSVG